MRPAVSVPTRVRRVHWASPTMQCGASLSAYSWNLQRTAYEPDVTCLVCLYHLGRYMPLSKLRDHQSRERQYAINRHTNSMSMPV